MLCAGCLVRSFQLWGAPGSWRKTFASRAAFERDSALCLDESREARAAAPRAEASEAAYVRFEECMREQGWKSGVTLFATRISPSELPRERDGPE